MTLGTELGAVAVEMPGTGPAVVSSTFSGQRVDFGDVVLLGQRALGGGTHGDRMMVAG